MLVCDNWNPLKSEWKHNYLFFNDEKEMREFIASQGKGIRVERMCELKDIK